MKDKTKQLQMVKTHLFEMRREINKLLLHDIEAKAYWDLSNHLTIIMLNTGMYSSATIDQTKRIENNCLESLDSENWDSFENKVRSALEGV